VDSQSQNNRSDGDCKVCHSSWSRAVANIFSRPDCEPYVGCPS
jgi:hypothetical protein